MRIMDDGPNMNGGAEGKAADIMRTRIGVMTYLALQYNVLDEAACKQLGELIDQCLQEREKRIVIDLANVKTLSSISLGAILDTVEKIIRDGGWLKVANVNTHVRDILDIAGVSDYVATLNPPEEKSNSVFLPVAMLEKKRLGDELVSRELITSKQLEQALEMQGNSGKRIGQILVEQKWVSESDLLPVLAQQLQVPYVKLNPQLYDPAIINIIDKNKTNQLCVLPLFKVRDVLLIATPSPLSIPSMMKSRTAPGAKLKPSWHRARTCCTRSTRPTRVIRATMGWTCSKRSRMTSRLSKMFYRMIIRKLMKWRREARSSTWSTR